MTYTLLQEGDPGIEVLGGFFRKIRSALGATAFGINEVRLPAGAAGVEHDETGTGHEEVYLVLTGAGTFHVDGEDVAVNAGDYLRVDAAATRQPVAGPEGMRFLAVGAQPNAAHEGRESL